MRRLLHIGEGLGMCLAMPALSLRFLLCVGQCSAAKFGKLILVTSSQAAEALPGSAQTPAHVGAGLPRHVKYLAYMRTALVQYRCVLSSWPNVRPRLHILFELGQGRCAVLDTLAQYGGGLWNTCQTQHDYDKVGICQLTSAATSHTTE